MKKLLFVLCALEVQSFIFAYDFKYRVTEDCTGYPEYEHLQKQTVKKGTVFNVDNVYTSTIYLNRYENVFENEYDDNDTPIIAVRNDATDLKVSAAYLELSDCSTKLPKKNNYFYKKWFNKESYSFVFCRCVVFE